MANNTLKFKYQEVEDFVTELYDYIWARHRFNSRSLEKMFAEKLSLLIEEPKKKASKFDNSVGDAVLSTQYLLRRYCEYAFQGYELDLIKSTIFFQMCVFETTINWIWRRSNIFEKVIDSAAIIAEAILFCDAKLNTVIELNRASSTFKNFFNFFLQEEFFEKCGWNGLKSKAFGDYHNLHLALKPYIYSVKFPYKKLHHNCHLTRKLRESSVVFPVEVSVTCSCCNSPTGDLSFTQVNGEGSFIKYFKKVVADGSIIEEEIFQRMNVFVKGYIEASSRFSADIEKNVGDLEVFLMVFLGKKEPEVQLVDEKFTKRKQKKKKFKPSKSSQISSAETTENTRA